MVRPLHLLFASLVLLTAAPAAGQASRPDPFVFVFDRDEKGATGEGLAWWLLEATIRPTGKSVAGVTLDRLNKEVGDPMSPWCHAPAFTSASFVSPSRRVQIEIEETFRTHTGSLFKATAAFTGGAVQDAVVGNYETCDGSVGAFLLITDRSPTPSIVYLKGFPEWQGMMWLAPDAEGLTVSSCFECGHAERLYYDTGRAQFYWVSVGD